MVETRKLTKCEAYRCLHEPLDVQTVRMTIDQMRLQGQSGTDDPDTRYFANMVAEAAAYLHQDFKALLMELDTAYPDQASDTQGTGAYWFHAGTALLEHSGIAYTKLHDLNFKWREAPADIFGQDQYIRTQYLAELSTLPKEQYDALESRTAQFVDLYLETRDTYWAYCLD